jgi:hypothetical protein
MALTENYQKRREGSMPRRSALAAPVSDPAWRNGKTLNARFFAHAVKYILIFFASSPFI